MIWFWIGSGGALGAVLRFYIATSVGRSSVVGFPLGIFFGQCFGLRINGRGLRPDRAAGSA